MKKSIYNLLLIKDRFFDAKLLIKMLKSIDDADFFKVKHVIIIASAQKFLENKKVDLIILYLMLPDSEGLETLNKIKSYAPNANKTKNVSNILPCMIN